MGSHTYDIGDSTLDALELQFGEQQLLPWAKMLQYDDPDPEILRLRQLLHTVRTHIKSFRVELRFLLIFLDYIRNWTNASISVQNLANLAIDIEALVQDSVDLLSNFASKLSNPNEWSTKLITVMANSWKRNDFKKQDLEERSLKLTQIFRDLMCRIGSLKKTVKYEYRFLSGKVFDHLSPLGNYIRWNKFVASVIQCFQVIRLNSEVSNPLKDQIKAFEDRFSELRSYLDQINISTGTLSLEPRIADFMNHVGAVAIKAAHISVWCWCEDEDLQGKIDVQFSENSDNHNEIDHVQQLEIEIAQDVSVLFSSLKQDLDLSTPAFLELNIGLLKGLFDYMGSLNLFGTSISRAQLFVGYLFDKTMEDGLLGDLEGLVNFYITKFEENRENYRCLLAEIKDILRDAALLKHIAFKENGTRLVSSQLLGKMLLARVEILLMDHVRISSSSFLSVNGQVIEIEDRVALLKLKISSDDPQDGCDEEGTYDSKKTFMVIEEVVSQIAAANSSLCDDELTNNGFVDVLSNLLVQIVLFKAESYLSGLLNSGASFIEIFKDRLVIVHKGLKFHRRLVAIQPKETTMDMELVVKLAEEVAREVIFLYHFYPVNEMAEEIILEFAIFLRGLLKKIKIIKDKLDETYLPFPKSGFPKTNGFGFINLLVQNIKELIDLEDESIAHVKGHIQTILGCLEFLKPFVSIIEDQNIDHTVNDIGEQIVSAAFQAEYVIDSIVIGYGPQLQTFSWLFDISEEFCYLKQKASIITLPNTAATKAQIHTQIPRSNASRSNDLETDDVVVSLSDQEEVVIDRLTRGTMQRGIVSVVGMPGVGKTTLAKKLYKSPKITGYFHVCAWCSVTQVYRKRELLLGILSCIGSLTENLLEMADEDLDMQLYRCLKQRRYLIVMDDMWNIDAWNALERSLPNDRNGSRILITSRIRDLMVEAKLDLDPHYLRPLSFDESWTLLQMKIFHAEHCPGELVVVGKQIAENCKGLPLAVVAIAGLLKRTDVNHKGWRSIADSLCSHIIDDPQSRCMDILDLSYTHLPNHLKACFLYFGAFLGNKDIQVYKLLLLWISERFVVETEHKSCEDLAEELLMDLVGRSLVIVTKRSSTGKVKTIRIHDLLRDLCISKAKDENFLHLVRNFDDELYASYDGLDYGVDFEHYGTTSSCTTYEDYRLCIRSKRRHFFMSTPSGQRVHSLLFFAANDMYPRCPYDISCIYRNFKLLKVLDLECINIGVSFPSGLETLVLLRYLALSGDIDSLPSSISKLLDLEILVVKGLKGKVIFPESVWYMASLRHICVKNHAIFSLPNGENTDFFTLDDLVTLSSISFSHREDSGKILSRLPNLKKLRFIYSDSREHYGANYPFPSLRDLTKLESLNIGYYGRAFNHSAFCFPVNLRKLTLSNFRLSWNHVSIIGGLQNLEVLKLLSRACDGERWEMTGGEFLKLRYLKLDTLNIVHWIASDDHLPNLEHLVIRNCSQLNEVPICFTEIPTLQMIEVQWCGNSVEESVRRIDEEGIEGLKVLINFTDLNFGLIS